VTRQLEHRCRRRCDGADTISVAIEARERAARQSAEDVAEFEEYGADLAKALDEQELVEAEEALRLGLKLDEEEEESMSGRESEDLKLARQLLTDEEQIETACEKDERLARQLEAEYQKEAARVAKLEKRERALAQRKLCKKDLQIAEELAAEIEAQEQALLREEARDRRLARQLVKQETKLLKELPQTQEKLKTMACTVNGPESVPMRTRLAAKLGSMRKSLVDMTNQAAIGKA